MKRLFPLLAVIVSVMAAYHILSIWRGVSLYQKEVTRERLLQASRLTSSNPDPYYRLGLLYQWDLRSIDLDESLRYLQKAVERNPLEQEYWLNAARAFQRMEKGGPFDHALDNAIRVYPTSLQGRWVAGNLLLQRGEIEKAILHFSYVLTHYPDQSHSVYAIWMNVVNDPDVILERLIPRDAASLNRYLSFLYGIKDKRAAKKAWEKRAIASREIPRSEILQHIEFFISQDDLSEAFRLWKNRLHEEGIPISDNGDVMTNGGFEKEYVLGGGFDWRITKKIPGALTAVDNSLAYEGKSSLKITFSGKENVDFHHVYQFVPLKADTEYRLGAQVKTKGLTTKSGIGVEISGIGPPFYGRSDSLIGDNPWKELTIFFHTPPRSRGGLVRVRRDPTDKFDRFISGLVWIDSVRLTEITKTVTRDQ